MHLAGENSSPRRAGRSQFGPAIHLPTFDAGAPRSQLKGRYADFDLDVANYNQTLINALSDVATQIATIRSIDQQSGDAQHVLNASTKAYLRPACRSNCRC